MPRISAFYGVVITMYFDEHAPPHFHARYAEFEAQIGIADGSILHGRLPRRVLGMVHEWAQLHASELISNWARARAGEALVTIEPLP
jgi:hypothetical protein